jgi:hypothetical protein
MDKIEINIIDSNWDYLPNGKCAQIIINDKPLIDYLKDFENKFDPKIAGRYAEMLKSDLDIQALLVIKDNVWIDVLCCDCGTPGCWPFQIKVKKKESSYSWYAFRQPHRLKDSAGGYWDYTSFEPFEFESNKYEVKIKKIT